MNRYLPRLVILLIVLLAVSCSGNGNALAPSAARNPALQDAHIQGPQTQLWGYYDVYIDIPFQTATAVCSPAIHLPGLFRERSGTSHGFGVKPGK